ncbi:MAG: isoamylase early set domain-containing protein [Phycisphaerae bacterium]
MIRIDGEWIEFRFFRPGAQAVHLAGDFNDWRQGELPMSLSKDGYWLARLKLPAGEYKFRYCADGEWFTDYAAFGVEPGEFGLDSLVRVPKRAVSLVARGSETSSESSSFAAA